ncbi:multicopper oxidase family protein [Streptomyces sp. NBC_00582]|uniref:multicopper oxidase family protein n=1 Tax=Streptomyces sp. NBC_00582 TaxID=2975783 RepID=UPI002E8014D4|nr:multicopper oxidase domain-containing protein [Streptomyces sp. NBC_00582]WUB66363.1 multicopper oxidase domain-containing protein [Streptomyces sp. NBC_00582]
MASVPRRGVLKGLPLAAGAVLAGRATSAQAASTPATGARATTDVPFPQPATRTVRPRPRRLETRLTVGFTEQHVPDVGTVLTRTYDGSLPGPTLRVRPGDSLQITHVNALPPNTGPAHHDLGMNVPHGFNTVNLHLHGMHVDPAGEADNVFRSFEPAGTARRTTTWRSVVDVPAHHPAGTFWYHPHHHGSTATHLLNGLAGVIVVEGDIDAVPEVAAAKDIVVCINELKMSGGKVPDLTSETTYDRIPSTFLVNGALSPVLTIAPGEVQRWRLVNAGALTTLYLSLDGQKMHQIAFDGITFMKPAAVTALQLPVGGRADLLVRGGEPGVYRLTAGGVSRPLMTLKVTGTPRRMSLPTRLPGRPTTLPAPTRRRSLIFRSYENVLTGDFRNAYRILGDGETPPADPQAGRADLQWGRFRPDYVNHRVRLGEVEEWTVTNDSRTHAHHPLHLHTNHFLVTAVNNRPLATPVWHDTVGLPPHGSLTFRLRAEDFTGRAMVHCHQSQHEDEGMMQIVEYVR